MTTLKRNGENDMQIEAEAMANCALMLLSRLNNHNDNNSSSSSDHHINDFECKTCNKHFPSFQALGGHRASHNKRPRLFGEYLVQTKKNNKIHKCSICCMEFSLGQALGGHMRRHRDEISKTLMAKIPVLKKSNSSKRIFCLDLNLTPNDYHVDDLKLWPATLISSPVFRCFF
ncbi:zinc finger protein ZAT11 [Capsicum galapagoense]